ncbi:hypothetical protein JRQ81_010789 [Phrynocephalus forsythii]|uniref:Solute carrier family 2, facilitated glucose transporter member 5 n=1 Tax=Phrynocephalus forsythii TaxID=171643 RepID=A0A9Q0Y142_9SAUR|nr:hypothetical protein JRQ81_010789 [Phrynocephalus forsythii]
MKKVEVGKEEGSRKVKLTNTLIRVSVASSLLSMQHGYNLWIVYSPSALMQDFYNISKVEEMKDPETQMVLIGITFALFPFGGIFGALTVGYLVDKFGREWVSLRILGTAYRPEALLSWTPSDGFPWSFILFCSRSLRISCICIISSVVPLYIGEVAPKSLRGGMIAMSLFFMNTGVVVAQIGALREILGTKKGWPILMGLAGLMPLTQLALLFSCPESPRYLLIQKRDEQSAREALKSLRERRNVDDEIEELRQEDLAERTEKAMTSFKLLRNPNLQWHVITIIVLMGGQQLSGVNAAYYYSERIFLSTKVGIDNVRFVTIAITALLWIGFFLAIFLADSMGRRTLALIGFGISAIICILITMTLEMQDTIQEMTYISTILLESFLFAYTLGPGPVPLILTVELFLQSTRSSACVIAGFVQWFINFLTGVSFYHIETRIGPYCFLIFFPICAATFFYIFKMVPETKDRTFLDVRRIMAIHTARKIQVQGPAGK